jgi:hypothetical protein
VQVGTAVILVDGEDVKKNARVVDLRRGYDPSLASTANRRPPPVDRVYQAWRRMETEKLLEVLDEQLELDAEESRWDEVAILLLERGKKDDDEALAGLFSRSGDLPSVEIEREWATLLVDAYRGAGFRTLEAIANLSLRDRRDAASLIVSASMTLFNGEFDAAGAPWPTRRIPRDLVPRGGMRGWDALAAAEREHRTSLQTASAES